MELNRPNIDDRTNSIKWDDIEHNKTVAQWGWVPGSPGVELENIINPVEKVFLMLEFSN